MSGSSWETDKYAPIKSAVLRGFESGEYHDLVLECQEYQFQVHKLIVCLQSPWLARAVKEKKKPSASVQLPEENPHIASAMLHYLYSATYSCPPSYSTQDFSIAMPPPMLFHLHLYSLAETLLILPLKSLAQELFQEVVGQEWNTEMFPDTIKRVYEITNPETGGDQLREIVVKIAASHGKELIGKGGAFGVMMGEVAEFGRDVFQVMMGAPVVEMPQVVEKERMVGYKCPVCPFEFYAKAIGRSEIACSACGVVSKKGQWRGEKEVASVNEDMEVDLSNMKTKEVNDSGEVNGLLMKSGIGADETEDKIEWNTMRANGECVKGTDAIVEKARVNLDESVSSKSNEKAAVVEETPKKKSEHQVDYADGFGSSEVEEVAMEPEKMTEVVVGKSAPERADSANGDVCVGGVEAKETAGEVEPTPAVPKKKKGKKNKKDKMSPMDAPASTPTSPRSTEAQIMGTVNGR